MFHTAVSESPVSIEIGPVTLTKIAVGPMDNNAYLLTSTDGVILIDAADDPQRLMAAIGTNKPKTIVTTHSHADHIQALTALAERYSPRLVAGAPDTAEIQRQSGLTIEPVWTADQITSGSIVLEVIGLRGHTPGSIALVLAPIGGPAHIFTGDSLFPGGLGKTNDRVAFDSLYADVTTQIFDRFADETVIHPGHGDATTLGAERPQLAEWWRRGW